MWLSIMLLFCFLVLSERCIALDDDDLVEIKTKRLIDLKGFIPPFVV